MSALRPQILNPAETFGDIIVDYSYVECSSACITALAAMRKRYPQHRRAEVGRALQRGKDYILSIQLPDGSWCAVGRPAARPLGKLYGVILNL